MKNKQASTAAMLVTAFLVWLALPLGAAAAQGDKYWGVKSGLIMPDEDGVDDIIPLTGVLGFGIGKDLSVEGEFTLSLAGGDVDGGGEVDVTALGGFLAFRPMIDSTKYFKAKVGIVNGEAELCVPFGGCVSEDDTSVAFGFGLGIKTSRTLTWEIEYTMMEFDDLDVDYFSVGVVSRF